MEDGQRTSDCRYIPDPTRVLPDFQTDCQELGSSCMVGDNWVAVRNLIQVTVTWIHIFY